MASAPKQRKTAPSFQDLPDELLVKIFQFSNALDRSNTNYVCSRFRHFINDFELVSYYADYQERKVPFSKLNIFDQRELKYLSLSGSKLNDYVLLDDMNKATSQIKYLNLINAEPKNVVLDFLSTCTNLEKLSLNCIPGKFICLMLYSQVSNKRRATPSLIHTV